MNQNQQTLNQYNIIATIGENAMSKTKLGVDRFTGQKVALKIFQDSLTEQTNKFIEQEIQSMQKLNHHNIVKLIDYNTGIYKYQNQEQQVSYIVYELSEGGDLMDLLLITGAFSEQLARHYFKQLIQGLDHCHKNGITHRDIKPDNLLLDKNFNLKISGFHFSTSIIGGDGSGKLTSQCGTMQYQAPEIVHGKPYKGIEVDIFSAGVTLFAMVNKSFPFRYSASVFDQYYQLIANNQIEQYWQKRNELGENTSEELKELLTCMFQQDPQQRPSINQIMQHRWMQGPLPTEDQIQNEVSFRRNIVIAEQELQRKQQQNQNKPKREMEQYIKLYELNTEFYSTLPAEEIEEEFISYLESKGMTYEKSEKKYKIKFSDSIDNSENIFGQSKTEICMKILRVNNEKVCIQFMKLKGSRENYIKLFQSYENEVLGFAFDTFLDE